MANFDLLAFLLASEPGGVDSSFGIASLRPRTRSGGVRGLVLKKFMGWDGCRIGKVEKCLPQTLCHIVTSEKRGRNFKTCFQRLGCGSDPQDLSLDLLTVDDDNSLLIIHTTQRWRGETHAELRDLLQDRYRRIR